VNGAAARLVHTGDKVIVVSYASYDEAELESYEPRVVHVSAQNEIVTVDDATARSADGTSFRRAPEPSFSELLA